VTSPRLTAHEVIELLDLSPLEGEGGFYRETVVTPNPEPAMANAPLNTAILFLVTAESWSGLHKLETDELFHFYMGDTCRMVVCSPQGELDERRLGTDLRSGCRVQTMVPGGMWQGTRLAGDDNGEFGYALLGTTMTPGFRQDQFTLATSLDLSTLPPNVADQLRPFLSPQTE
jgi:predicted cupin superfamily sugar epimerase